YIRSICGSDEGIWSPVSSFNTLCAPITGNFFEDFDNAPVGSWNNFTVPMCWNSIDNNNSKYGYVANYWGALSGSNSYSFYNGTTGDVVLISPETVDLGNGTKQLRFSAYYDYGNIANTLTIYSLNSNTPTATRTKIQTIAIP